MSDARELEVDRIAEGIGGCPDCKRQHDLAMRDRIRDPDIDTPTECEAHRPVKQARRRRG